MHGPVVSRDISGLARKKQCIFNWSPEHLLCLNGSDFAVTVSSSRKGVALPIMKMRAVKASLEVLQWNSQQPAQRLQTVFDHK